MALFGSPYNYVLGKKKRTRIHQAHRLFLPFLIVALDFELAQSRIKQNFTIQWL